MIKINVWSHTPPCDWHAAQGWDPNVCSGDDYTSDRAKSLYQALGASPSEEEYVLCANITTGAWALFGLTVEGHRWAEEIPKKHSGSTQCPDCRLCPECKLMAHDSGKLHASSCSRWFNENEACRLGREAHEAIDKHLRGGS